MSHTQHTVNLLHSIVLNSLLPLGGGGGKYEDQGEGTVTHILVIMRAKTKEHHKDMETTTRIWYRQEPNQR